MRQVHWFIANDLVRLKLNTKTNYQNANWCKWYEPSLLLLLLLCNWCSGSRRCWRWCCRCIGNTERIIRCIRTNRCWRQWINPEMKLITNKCSHSVYTSQWIFNMFFFYNEWISFHFVWIFFYIFKFNDAVIPFRSIYLTKCLNIGKLELTKAIPF